MHYFKRIQKHLRGRFECRISSILSEINIEKNRRKDYSSNANSLKLRHH